MDVRIEPRPLSGAVTPPPSKSQAHRLIIAACLAEGVSTLSNISLSQDIQATLRCMEALGSKWSCPAPHTLQITGIGGAPRRGEGGPLPELDCGESGSTLRFLIPVALAVAGGGVFRGRGRLMERPQQPYFDLFRRKEITYDQQGDALTLRGALTPGEYRLPGDVSSQFFTGLLFALPLLDGPSRIVATTAVESWDYLLMTLDALAGAGVTVKRAGGETDCFPVEPACYLPCEKTAEGDWSQGAFWYAANFLGGSVKIEGLNSCSAQGDKVVGALYRQLAPPGDTEIDLSNCPDLLPPLAVMAAVRRGVTRFTHAARLRLKESDRLRTTAALVSALGGQAEELPDGLIVRGVPALTGGTVDGSNDHRIVMAAAVAAAHCQGPVTITGAQAVEKSYPGFFQDYEALGGVVHVL